VEEERVQASDLASVQEGGLREVSWHVLRHTFASHLVMRGAAMKVVQELLGHATIEMTMRYAPQSRENGHLGQVEERGQWTEQVIAAICRERILGLILPALFLAGLHRLQVTDRHTQSLSQCLLRPSPRLSNSSHPLSE
jgi:hypothetical protein